MKNARSSPVVKMSILIVVARNKNNFKKNFLTICVHDGSREDSGYCI